MDITSLDAGVDFAQRIGETLDGSEVVIAIIGPAWEGVAPDGTRRIDVADDLVRLEITGAMSRGVTIVPVTVGGRTMPSADTLPEEMRPLVRHNAVDVSDTRWRYDTDRLLASLDHLGVRGRRRVWLLLAGAGLAVLAAVVALALTHGDSTTKTTAGTTTTTAAGGPPGFTKLVLRSDFATDDGSWSTGIDQRCRMEISANHYLVTSELQYRTCSPHAALAALDEVYAVAHVHYALVPDNPEQYGAGSAGLSCHQRTDITIGAGYDVDVSPNGDYVMRRSEDGRFTMLASGHAPDARFDGEDHDIAIRCRRDGAAMTITLIIDGQGIETATDTNPLPAGTVGVVLNNWGTHTNSAFNDCLAANGGDPNPCSSRREESPIQVAFSAVRIYTSG
jgi:hypothetical protein